MGEISYHHLTRKVTTISPINADPFYHKEVCSELAPKAVDLFLSLEERTDLGIGEAAGAPLRDHLVSVVFCR